MARKINQNFGAWHAYSLAGYSTLMTDDIRSAFRQFGRPSYALDVGLLAAFVPTLRIARIDPADTLRSE